MWRVPGMAWADGFGFAILDAPAEAVVLHVV